ncbi:MAG TPA: A/G-specific adenine glycosylase [Halothiobacillus sp.]|nr:A/G-specific adenine glycosylase [Halothiobacillus sp.]
MTDHHFAERLLAWYEIHGRHDLPWQHPRNAYRVWVSEIMLQQTQVQTVIGYFQRFMQRFPDISSLAAASLDEVLALWAGLGYYARARNLHRAARQIIDKHQGQFPKDLAALMALPGIGRSTAGAILAQAFGLRAPILDGNVKRVLARHAAIEGPPTVKAVENQLWALAEQYTPQKNLPEYTQAIMDLGATICTRHRPQCLLCPVNADCRARQMGRVEELPTRKPKKSIPLRKQTLLVARSDQGLLLVKRPPTGIWGGLWSLPVLDENEPESLLTKLGLEATGQAQVVGEITHLFSHFRLQAQLLQIPVKPRGDRVFESSEQLWYNPQHNDRTGLPVPIAQYIANLERYSS